MSNRLRDLSVGSGMSTTIKFECADLSSALGFYLYRLRLTYSEVFWLYLLLRMIACGDQHSFGPFVNKHKEIVGILEE